MNVYKLQNKRKKKKNSGLYDYRFDSVETEFGKTTKAFVDYPQITDRILLELIRLGLNYDFVIHSKSVEELKEKLLPLLMYNEAEFKHQVQTLFKEG